MAITAIFLGSTACGGGGGGGSSNAAPTTPAPTNRAPVFTSAASLSLNENSSNLNYSLQATDADGDSLVYRITGGEDQQFFSLDSATGKLGLNITPDYEAPRDNGGDNRFNLVVEVSDGKGGSSSMTVQLVIVDMNEATNGFYELQPWTMFRGTAAHTAFVPLRLNTATPGILWEKRFDFAVNGAVSIDNMVFVSEGEEVARVDGSAPHHFPSVYAFEAISGNLIWSQQIDDISSTPDFQANGQSFYSPSVGEGLVFVNSWIASTEIGDRTEFFALNYLTGQKQYSIEIEERSLGFGTYPVTVYGGSLYVTDKDEKLVGSLDAKTGEAQWAIEATTSNSFSPVPTLAGSKLYLQRGSVNEFITIDINNQEFEPSFSWSCSLLSPDGFVSGSLLIQAVPLGPNNTAAGITRDCIASFLTDANQIDNPRNWLVYGPDAHDIQSDWNNYHDLYLGDGILFALAGFSPNRVEAYDQESGDYLWTVSVGEQIVSMVITYEHIIVSTYWETTIYRVADQQEIWSYPAGGELALTDTGILLISSKSPEASTPEAPGYGTLTAVRLAF